MTDHLPECPHSEPHLSPGFLVMCICDRLRACEQRVLDSVQVRDAVRAAHDLGRAKGVQAARDAVAAVKSDTGWGKTDALAAIDALRGDA